MESAIKTVSEQQKSAAMTFPDQLTGSVDLSRLIRELSALHDSLHQATIRTPGDSVQLPKTSKVLEELASLNHVSLLETKQREQLLEVLRAFYEHAPVLHVSFASEPSTPFTKSLITWMRRNISPVVLVEIGLQPTITAGCVVRTTNKYFDLSLKHRFHEARPILVSKLGEAAK